MSKRHEGGAPTSPQEKKPTGQRLSLESIERHDLPKRVWNPDWDDSGYEFTLPSGLVLQGLYRCNNEPVEMDGLEGLDGFIVVRTEEELEHLIGLTWEETLQEVKSKNSDFNIEDYE